MLNSQDTEGFNYGFVFMSHETSRAQSFELQVADPHPQTRTATTKVCDAFALELLPRNQQQVGWNIPRGQGKMYPV